MSSTGDRANDWVIEPWRDCGHVVQCRVFKESNLEQKTTGSSSLFVVFGACKHGIPSFTRFLQRISSISTTFGRISREWLGSPLLPLHLHAPQCKVNFGYKVLLDLSSIETWLSYSWCKYRSDIHYIQIVGWSDPTVLVSHIEIVYIHFEVHCFTESIEALITL